MKSIDILLQATILIKAEEQQTMSTAADTTLARVII